MPASALGPLDEFPVHQLPQPIAWPGDSDRNFYDRAYLNAHDRSGNIFLITGIGYYPNLGVKDAFVLIRRRGDDGGEGTQTAVHCRTPSTPIVCISTSGTIGSRSTTPSGRCTSRSMKPRASQSISPGTACSTRSWSSLT